MNSYFKFHAESDLGIGIQYIEFDDDWPIRQAECYGDRWFNSSQRYHKELGCGGLCDQPLTAAGIKLGKQIDAKEFELVWDLSNKMSAKISMQPTIEIYTWRSCPFCIRAKALLSNKGVEFTEYAIDGDELARTEMSKRSNGRRSVPQIFVDGVHIGGCDDLHDLEIHNKLDTLLGIELVAFHSTVK